MDWSLLRDPKRYIENALIAGTGGCEAEANVETIGTIVEGLPQ